VRFHVGMAEEWYGQSIAPTSANPQYDRSSITEVPAVSLNSLLEGLDCVDLIDLDVQNAEFEVLGAAAGKMDRIARRVHVGTHSPEAEAGVRSLFRDLRWYCLNDYPSNGSSETPYGVIPFQDGVQTWINPRWLQPGVTDPLL